eukprot:202292_1
MNYIFVLYVLNTILYAQNIDNLVVQTNYGAIRGAATSNTRYFTSIPYAAAPINELRFENPIEPVAWFDDVYNATTDPPGCIQQCVGGFYCPSVISEDCLFLNIFTSLFNISNTSLLNVNVFIHGGAWVTGYSAPNTVWNATQFVVNTNSILVSLNHRLSILGLFYHPQYPSHFKGNYGMMDIIMALKWIKNNIQQFGGNKNKINLFAHTSGSGNIAILATMEDFEVYNLFNSAIIISNPFYGAPIRTTKDWGRIPNLILEYANCSNEDNKLQCMRDVNAITLVTIMNTAIRETKYDKGQYLFNGVSATPTIGTGLFNEQPLIAVNNGHFNQNASYILGITSFETLGLTFSKFADLNTDYVSFTNYMEKMVGKTTAQKILENYPMTEPEFDPNDVRYPPYSATITTYGRYICPTLNAALAMDTYYKNMNRTNKLYYFHYNHINTFSSFIFSSTWLPYCEVDGVCHGSEGQIIFNSPSVQLFNLSDDEVNLSISMQHYVNNLVETVDNKQYILQEWEPFDSINKNTMMFNNGSSMIIKKANETNDEQQCLFWDDIGYKWLEPPSSESSDDSLAIVIGVVFGVVIGVIIIGVLVWYFRKRKYGSGAYTEITEL